MKYYVTTFLYSCLIIPTLIAQDLSFIQNYGGLSYDDARGIVEADDGNFVFAGLNKSGIDPEGDMYLTKINATGEVLWQKTYGKPLEDGANHLLKCSDGGYLMSGHVAFGGGICDGYVVKTDADGVEEWSLYVGGPLDDLTQQSLEYADGNYFLTGTYQNESTLEFDVLLAKISANGDLIFVKNIAKEGDQSGIGICSTIDGNLIVCGYSLGLNSVDEDVHIVKLDIDGNVIWAKTEVAPLHNRAWRMVATNDGGFVVSGGSALQKYTGEYQTAFIARYDGNGNREAYKELLSSEGKSYGYELCHTPAGGYALSGCLKENGADYGSPCLMIMDNNLSLQEHYVFESSDEAYVRTLVRLNNGEYLLAGAEKVDSTNSDVFVARVNKIAASVNDVAIFSDYSVFPNPFNNYAIVQVPEGLGLKLLRVYDLNGKLLQSIEFEDNRVQLKQNSMISGTYLYTINNNKGRLTSGKIVVR